MKKSILATIVVMNFTNLVNAANLVLPDTLEDNPATPEAVAERNKSELYNIRLDEIASTDINLNNNGSSITALQDSDIVQKENRFGDLKKIASTTPSDPARESAKDKAVNVGKIPVTIQNAQNAVSTAKRIVAANNSLSQIKDALRSNPRAFALIANFTGTNGTAALDALENDLANIRADSALPIAELSAANNQAIEAIGNNLSATTAASELAQATADKAEAKSDWAAKGVIANNTAINKTVDFANESRVKIDKNASNIVRNADLSKENDIKISANTLKIDGNIERIDKNTNVIAVHETRLDKHDVQLASHKDSIAQNTANVEKLEMNFNKLSADFYEFKSVASKGIAGVAAMAQIDSVYAGVGEVFIGAGVGSFNSEGAVAIGLGYRATEALSVRAAGSFASGDAEPVIAAGMTYTFK